MKNTCLFYFASQVFLVLITKSYMIQLSFRLVDHFKVSVGDCSPQISGWHSAMPNLMLTVKI